MKRKKKSGKAAHQNQPSYLIKSPFCPFAFYRFSFLDHGAS